MFAPGDPDDQRARARYAFWSSFTAVQARRSGHDRAEIDARVERFFRHVCEVVEPTVSLEIGAHAAEFSRWARRQFPDARCIAVEANPYVHEKHRDRLARAGVDYRHAAASTTAGTVSLNIPTEVHGIARQRTSRMASLAVHAKSAGQEVVEVPAVPVDDLTEVGPEDRVVAWVDVEGATGQVLPGGVAALARAAAVFIEVESSPTWDGQWLDADVAAYFEALGKIPVLRDIQRPHQYNVVFLDPELAARPEIARRAARALAPPG